MPRGPLYDASPEWLKKNGLKAKDAQRLFKALCTLVDYEKHVKTALVENGTGASADDHSNVCAALRYLVDGEASE